MYATNSSRSGAGGTPYSSSQGVCVAIGFRDDLGGKSLKSSADSGTSLPRVGTPGLGGGGDGFAVGGAVTGVGGGLTGLLFTVIGVGGGPEEWPGMIGVGGGPEERPGMIGVGGGPEDKFIGVVGAGGGPEDKFIGVFTVIGAGGGPEDKFIGVFTVLGVDAGEPESNLEVSKSPKAEAAGVLCCKDSKRTSTSRLRLDCTAARSTTSSVISCAAASWVPGFSRS